MGKALLIIATASIIGVRLILFSGVQQSVLQAEQQLGEHEAEVLARQIALTGLAEARQAALARPQAATAATLTGAHMGGSYRATLTPGTEAGRPAVTIRVDGRVPLGAAREAATHTIEMTYALVDGGEGGGSVVLPPFMRGAITAGGLNLNGTTIHATNRDENADIHIVSGAPGGLNNNNVAGFLYHNGGTLGDHTQSWLESQFHPNVNPRNESSVQHAGPVDIPPFDTEAFRNKPGVQVWPYNQQNINGGTLDLGGTPGNPALWYFPQDVNINNVTMKGHAVLVRDGYFNLGNITREGDASFVFYANGYNINWGIDMPLHLFANDHMSLNGLEMTGSIVVRGYLNLNGATINKAAPPVDLVDPVFPGEEGPGGGEPSWQPTNYREWAARSRPAGSGR